MTQSEFMFRLDTTSPGVGSETAVQSDTEDLPTPYRALVVFGAGNVKFRGIDGKDDTWSIPSQALPATILVAMKRVWVTGTTAVGLKGIF